jgi:hypothetical protein
MTLDLGDRRVGVSKRIREEFDNGKEYCKLEDQLVREPNQTWARPITDNLEFHAEIVDSARPSRTGEANQSSRETPTGRIIRKSGR